MKTYTIYGRELVELDMFEQQDYIEEQLKEAGFNVALDYNFSYNTIDDSWEYRQ